MKKLIVLLVIVTANFTITAQDVEMAVVPQYKSLNQAWKMKTIKHGDQSHAGTIAGENYPGVWSYWYIKSGEKPENFQLSPLKADRISKSALKWKRPVLASKSNAKTFKTPALVGGIFYIHQTADYSQGGGYSFTNPLKVAVNIIIEGNLRFSKGADVYIYKRDKDGNITFLTSNKKENAVHEVSNKYPDGRISVRTYLKLLCEAKLNHGEQIFIIARHPNIKLSGKAAGKIYPLFQPNDNWGKSWQPTFVAIKVNDK